MRKTSGEHASKTNLEDGTRRGINNSYATQTKRMQVHVIHILRFLCFGEDPTEVKHLTMAECACCDGHGYARLGTAQLSGCDNTSRHDIT